MSIRISGNQHGPLIRLRFDHGDNVIKDLSGAVAIAQRLALLDHMGGPLHFNAGWLLIVRDHRRQRRFVLWIGTAYNPQLSTAYNPQKHGL